MALLGRHFLSVKGISVEDRDQIFQVARRLSPIAKGEQRTNILRGAVMGSMFFEASTRTRLSFDSAFMRLGGSVSHTQGTEVCSISKGESYFDTGRVTGGFYDVLVMRHKDPEAIEEFCSATNIPVINGGSGPKEHPTQALLDVFTILDELTRNGKCVDGSVIALVGDLKYGRTVHSLIYLMSLYANLTFVALSPDVLGLPEDVTKYAIAHGHKVVHAKSLEDVLGNADIVYATRLQKERLPEADKIESLGPSIQITRKAVELYGKKDIVIMHPLPRDSRPEAFDLSADLTGDPRLAVFRQTDNGVLIRMALFLLILGLDKDVEKTFEPVPWFRPAKIGTIDTSY